MKSNAYLDYLLGDIFEEALQVTSRPMMGGYILYSEGKTFAIAENDQLWFKGSHDVAEWYLSRGSKKFSYSKEGKEQTMNYYLVPEEILEDKNKLNEWIDVALSVATLPKKKQKN